MQEYSAAVDTCNGIGQRAYVDRCLSEVADSTKNLAACEGIVSDEIRDSCYMTFAYNKDFSVCPKVTSTYLKNSCYLLSQLAQLPTKP